MKVSIITVCYNSSATIKDAIESVMRQTYQNIEYIIVDGNSSDNTLDLVNDYKVNIDLIISEPDEGIYDAMNKGIAAATGDIIGILNSDDFYETTDAITRIVEIFSEHKEVDGVYGDVVFVHGENLQKITRYYSSAKFKDWKLRFGWMPPHPATFIKRSVYQKFGDYQLGYKIAADYEIFVRLMLKEQRIFRRIDKTIVRMRMGGASTSGIKSSYVLNREIVRACLSNGIYTNMIFVLTKIPFKLLELIKRPSK